MKLIPRNRYVVIEVEKEEQKEKSTVLLPEGYKKNEEPFVAAKVVSLSPKDGDYPRRVAKAGDIILVGKHMIESVKYKDHSYDIILENHIVGVLRD